jgi:hypothetical protein
LHQIVVEDIKADPTGMTYYYQSDIYHFYDSIDQGIMKSQVRQYISDELLLPIMDSFVELLPKGLSKGLRSSQALANLHLSEIDHKMCSVVTTHLIDSEAEDVEPIVIFKGCGVLTDKDGRQIRYHNYRYCDDVVVTAADKKSLWKVRDYLVSLLAELKLHIKPTEAVRPMTVGLDYLGYVTFLTETKHKGKVEYGVYSRVRKRTKQKFARRMVRVKSRKRRQTLIGSFYGMAAHGDCKHLLKKLLTPAEYGKLKYIKRGMRDFGDIEFTPTLIDGQKNFNGQSISGRELDHKGFIVYDFQRDVIPRREKDEYAIRLQQAEAKGMSKDLVEKPKTKYVVQIILDGKIRKMWTGDKEQWHFLEEAEQQGEIPFFSSMEVDYDGKYPKCRFCSAKKYGIPIPSDAELATLLAKLNLKTE